MSDSYKKYRPLAPRPNLPDRRWPSRTIEKAPLWCSVDLRDGNQALIEPMGVDEKLRMFAELVRIGFKEIEIGFPSSNDTEFEFTRTLIEGGHIPDDVTIQVLVQSREHLIRRTFEAIRGAKNVIIHLYNATSEPVRRIVFDRTPEEVTQLAVDGARLIRTMSDKLLEEMMAEEEEDTAPAESQAQTEEIAPAQPAEEMVEAAEETVEAAAEEEPCAEAAEDAAADETEAKAESKATEEEKTERIQPIIDGDHVFYPIPPARPRPVSDFVTPAEPETEEETEDEDDGRFTPIPPARRGRDDRAAADREENPADKPTAAEDTPAAEEPAPARASVSLFSSISHALSLFADEKGAAKEQPAASALQEIMRVEEKLQEIAQGETEKTQENAEEGSENPPETPEIVIEQQEETEQQETADSTEQNSEEKKNRKPAINIRYEYSPEFFSATEPEYIVEICGAVLDALGATAEQPVIINLPSSVELSTPNIFADQVEYFCRKLPDRERAIISVHTHNDQGTGVAAAELAMLAGAERVEGTLFGNGERTGNCDLITMALNLMTQGIDPQLDLSDLVRIRTVYERCTRMHVYERQPYSGELVFTAFSGSHQDAISKGMAWQESGRSQCWEVPYLPMCPADIGRQYEPIIRINSQSGKGGAAFVLQRQFGYVLPRDMHPEFGIAVKHAADERGSELTANDVLELLHREYIDIHSPYALASHSLSDASGSDGSVTTFRGELSCHGKLIPIEGSGNGPVDAFFDALGMAGIEGFRFVSYHEHAIGAGSDAQAVAYIELRTPQNRTVFGVGVDRSINLASIKGVLCAVNRAFRMK